MRTLGTVVLLIAALGFAQAQDADAPWIANGDFEADELPWDIGVIDHDVTHSGDGAMRLDCPGGTERVVSRCSEIELNHDEPETILAKMWLRLDATKQTGPIRAGVSFHIDWRGGTGLSWYGPFEISPELAGSWTYHEARIKAIAPIERIRPMLFVQGIEGSISLDEISLGTAQELPRVPRETVPVSVTGKNGRFADWARFEFTQFRPTAHVFHFTDADTTNLALDASINVLRPAPIYLNSAWGSQYWTLYSPDRRELAEIYTDERIDLSDEGPQDLHLTMSGAHHGSAGELAPGGWVFVTDRFKSWLIYGTEQAEGEDYLDPATGKTFSYWDSVKLDPLSRALGASGTVAAFSVADLSSYEFFARGRWGDGEVILRPMLRDAQGNAVPLHGLSLTVELRGERLRAREITEDGVPTGDYTVAWPEAPRDISEMTRVRASVALATPDGLVRATLDEQVGIGAQSLVHEPDALELIAWGSGHYAVSPTPAEGPASMERLVADVKAAGVSRLIVHGRGSRDDAYPSTISTYPDPEFDQLIAAQAAGVEHGVDIYAGYILGVAQPADLEAHPDWAQIGANGKPGTWYCYNNPEVRAFHASLIQEIGRNCDLTGIALDYCRPGSGCHCAICEALFQERYGRSLADVDSYDEDWLQFRRDSITSYIRELRAALREANPEMKLAGYVWGRLGPDADRGGQDWPLWLNEDLMDWVCVGQYTPSTPMFRAQCHTLKTIAEGDLDGDTTRIFPLLGASYIQRAFPSYRQADAVIDRHLQAASEEGLTGAGYFPTSSIRTHAETSARHAR